MILVVDDDLNVQAILKTILAAAGYDCVIANNGREALDIIKVRKDIKLMLLDLLMPEISGTELLEIMEQDKINIPTIVLTGFIGEMKEVVRNKPLSILTKPFNVDHLIEEVERGLNEQSPEIYS